MPPNSWPSHDLTSSIGREDMDQQNQVLLGAIRKLALAGEQARFSVEEMIELLKTGVSAETLLDLVCCRLELIM